MPADVLAPNGARPSAGTALTTQLDKILQMFYAAVEDFLIISNLSGDIFWQSWQDLGKYHSVSERFAVLL